MRRQPSALPRLLAGLCFAGAASTVALAGCGSRGPLDDEATSVDAAIEAEAVVDAALEVAEAGPDATRRDAGAVACGVCVLTTCGDAILACIQSDGCRAVFQCVATTCLGGDSGGGGLNPLCLFQCAGEDPSGALGVLSVFQCITGECGADCGSVLGGLGGGFGNGGGGGGGGGGSPDAFRELLSPWPQLFSPAAVSTPSGAPARERR